jgi:hypothetical protein
MLAAVRRGHPAGVEIAGDLSETLAGGTLGADALDDLLWND